VAIADVSLPRVVDLVGVSCTSCRSTDRAYRAAASSARWYRRICDRAGKEEINSGSGHEERSRRQQRPRNARAAALATGRALEVGRALAKCSSAGARAQKRNATSAKLRSLRECKRDAAASALSGRRNKAAGAIAERVHEDFVMRYKTGVMRNCGNERNQSPVPIRELTFCL
jgi:hypothetical protein